jgi:hypothetical protein
MKTQTKNLGVRAFFHFKSLKLDRLTERSFRYKSAQFLTVICTIIFVCSTTIPPLNRTDLSEFAKKKGNKRQKNVWELNSYHLSTGGALLQSFFCSVSEPKILDSSYENFLKFRE